MNSLTGSLPLAVALVGLLLALVWLTAAHAVGALKLVRVHLSEFLLVGALSTIGVVTLIGLGAAYMSWFRPDVVLGALVLVCVVLVAMRRRYRFAPVRLRTSSPGMLAVGCAAVFAAYCAYARFHHIDGMRDPGVYVASGIELARTGNFGWTDGLVSEFGIQRVRYLFIDYGWLYEGKPRWCFSPGFYLNDSATGEIWPQFLHAYDVWLALAYWCGGPQATMCVNGVFGGLGVLALFCVVRLWGGNLWALCAALLLALSPAQLWFGRFPGNEHMTQCLVLGFLFLASVAALRAKPDDLLRGIATHLPTRTMVWAMGFLVIAALGKFAVWPLVVGVGAALGAMAALRVAPFGTVRAWAVLSVGAVLFLLHGLVFANFYVFGSWNFTGRRFGLPFESMPMLFLCAVAAAYSLSAMSGSVIRKVLAVQQKRGVRVGLAVIVAVALGATLAYQFWMQSRTDISQTDFSNTSNLFILTKLLGPVSALLAFVGFVLLMSRRFDPRYFIPLSVVGLSMILVVNRNFDGVYPWASRRWVPVVFPVLAICAAYVITRGLQFIRGQRRFLNAASMAVALCVGATQILGAPLMVMVRQDRGLIPAADRIAHGLTPQDIVLLHPTTVVAMFQSYWKARFDINSYVMPPTAARWAVLLRTLREARTDGRRIVYVSDTPLTDTASLRTFLTPLARNDAQWTNLPDRRHNLANGTVAHRAEYFSYEVWPENVPEGWDTQTTTVAVRQPRVDLPAVLSMKPENRFLLNRMFEATPAGPETFYRWTDGAGRIYLGDWLTTEALREVTTLTVTLSSNRPERKDPVWVHLSHEFNTHSGAEGTTLTSAALPANPTEVSVAVPPGMLGLDSVLTVGSLRHKVGEALEAGRVGVAVWSVRAESPRTVNAKSSRVYESGYGIQALP